MLSPKLSEGGGSIGASEGRNHLAFVKVEGRRPIGF
jgi:hypothetical protein